MGSPGKGDRVRVGVGVGVEGSPEEGALGVVRLEKVLGSEGSQFTTGLVSGRREL